MKFLLAFVVCFSFAAVLAVTEEEMKEKLKKAHDKCQADPHTAVDEAEMKAFKESHNTGTEPTNLDQHMLCISKALHWQNADGTVNKEHLKERITAAVHDSAKVDAIVADCSVEKENEMATARHLIKCFHDHAKVSIHAH